MSVSVGRVCVGGEGSFLVIGYSYLCNFYHKWGSQCLGNKIEFKAGIVEAEGNKGLDGEEAVERDFFMSHEFFLLFFCHRQLLNFI